MYSPPERTVSAYHNAHGLGYYYIIIILALRMYMRIYAYWRAVIRVGRMYVTFQVYTYNLYTYVYIRLIHKRAWVCIWCVHDLRRAVVRTRAISWPAPIRYHIVTDTAAAAGREYSMNDAHRSSRDASWRRRRPRHRMESINLIYCRYGINGEFRPRSVLTGHGTITKCVIIRHSFAAND